MTSSCLAKFGNKPCDNRGFTPLEETLRFPTSRESRDSPGYDVIKQGFPQIEVGAVDWWPELEDGRDRAAHSLRANLCGLVLWSLIIPNHRGEQGRPDLLQVSLITRFLAMF